MAENTQGCRSPQEQSNDGIFSLASFKWRCNSTWFLITFAFLSRTAKNVWKKRFFDEKRKTAPLEEQVNRLRYDMQVQHKALLSYLESKGNRPLIAPTPTSWVRSYSTPTPTVWVLSYPTPNPTSWVRSYLESEGNRPHSPQPHKWGAQQIGEWIACLLPCNVA